MANVPGLKISLAHVDELSMFRVTFPAFSRWHVPAKPKEVMLNFKHCHRAKTCIKSWFSTLNHRVTKSSWGKQCQTAQW